MAIINSWRSKKKGWDKYGIKIRLGKITLFEIYIDYSRNQYGIIFCNLGLRTAIPQKERHEKNRIHHEDNNLL
ncbi:MAG TPA: hypothetical protein PLX62_11780 [Bacteroidales bacterium]|jgi:hypothetical protein|nr:hypothetical protein [Bacteroidales bacterium]